MNSFFTNTDTSDVLEAVECADGVYRIPKLEKHEWDDWKVIPFQLEAYKLGLIAHDPKDFFIHTTAI